MAEENQPKSEFKLISKSEEIKKRLELEGKMEILDKPEHIAAINRMNKSMEKFMRTYPTINANPKYVPLKELPVYLDSNVVEAIVSQYN
jgi:hypothetical protein